MPIEVTVTAIVQIPRVPNFLMLQKGGEEKVPLSALSDDDLRVIGSLWTSALIDRAAEQRKSDADR